MARIFLIRHGEPVAGWGEADDPGLSERGRAQAASAAELLAQHGLTRIVSSPMRRCRETASPLAERLGLAALSEPRVSEVATPAAIGDRRSWLEQTFPWRAGAPASTWPNLDPALLGWRASLLEAARDWTEDCAVFTHFIAINVMVGAALGRAETIVCRPDHASITELTVARGALFLQSLGAEMQTGEVR